MTAPLPTEAPRTFTADQEDRFRQELLTILARQAADVPLPVAASLLVIAAIVWSTSHPAVVCGWIVVALTVLFVRRWLIPKIAAQTDVPTTVRIRNAVFTSIGSGIAQGSASVLFFTGLDLAGRSMVTMIMIGMLAGAVAVLGGHRASFAAYAIPVVFGLAAMWLASAFQPDGFAWLPAAIAVLALGSGLVMMRFAAASQRLLRQAFAAGLAEEEAKRHAERGWREAELQLQRAEEANRAKTRFLSAASHDLRQPLQAMLWLGQSLVDADRDNRREIVERMSESIGSLERLLQQLLSRSQLDAGVVKPDWTTVNLGILLDQVQTDFAGRAAEKGLALEMASGPDTSARSDRTLLLSILRNLVDNAIKYTAQGSVRVSATTHADSIQITVSDTGRGIPDDERERVFEEFYQLDNRHRDASRGFGLGLSIVRGYCQLLGIDIDLHSRAGHGTTVTLRVPAAAHESSAETPALAPSVPARLPEGLRVLMIEDDPRVRTAQRALLESLDCETTVGASVADAAVAAANSTFDLVISDYRLPDGNGLAAVAAVRERVGAGTPALIISGDIGVAELREVADSGLELLTKPVTVNALVAAACRAIAQARYGPGEIEQQ